MSRIECPFETEILDAVVSGRWPGRADAALRGHVSTCGICTEVAQIAMLYRDDFASALEHVRVPSAGFVWWKSELRARREAVRTASRPISMVSGIAAVAVVLMLAGILKGLHLGLDMASVSAFVVSQPLLLWFVLGAVLALTPIAIYFVYSDE